MSTTEQKVGINEKDTLFKYRKVAQIVLKATTPLKVGSGESDAGIDAPVLKNWNGYPMIQGSSMAGVLRASFTTDKEREALFGKDFGSRVLVSHVHLVDENEKIPYGLGDTSPFLEQFRDLPIREHTAIAHTGAAKGGSKFDEEIVYKGSKFKFELEFLTDNSEADNTQWNKLLTKLVSPLFRLGGGSTKGFGEMKVDACKVAEYEIGKDYHTKPSDLNKSKGTEASLQPTEQATTYHIAIQADDFFSFGAGFGDDEVDDVIVKEKIVQWEEVGKFTNEQILMPASSLKGALSHRVAFHYNRLKCNYADTIPDDMSNYIGEKNKAVATLFGHKKELDNNGEELGQKGKALFSDLYQQDKGEYKIFDHVKIDRFTGGAVDSALYNEKVTAQKDIWKIKILLAEDIDTEVQEAFEATLDDLCKGWLPLGGKVNRGHGVFVGVTETKGGYGENGWICEGGCNHDEK